MIPQMEKCCCAVALRTGAVIISTAYIVVYLSFFICEIYVYCTDESSQSKFMLESQEQGVWVLVNALIFMVTTCLSVSLVVGIVKESVICVLVWIMWELLRFFYLIVYIIVITLETQRFQIHLVLAILSALVSAYCFVTIYSYLNGLMLVRGLKLNCGRAYRDQLRSDTTTTSDFNSTLDTEPSVFFDNGIENEAYDNPAKVSIPVFYRNGSGSSFGEATGINELKSQIMSYKKVWGPGVSHSDDTLGCTCDVADCDDVFNVSTV